MKIIKKLFKEIPYPPIFFSVSFVLVLFSHNKGELTITRIISPILIVIFFSLTVYIFSSLLLKTKQKRIIFSSIFSILFFSYGEILSLIGNIQNHILFSVLVVTLLSLFVSLRKTKKDLEKFSKYFMIISFIAIFIPILEISNYEIVRAIQKKPENPLSDIQIDRSQLNRSEFPDIYYIIADSYSSENILKQHFNYDNGNFISYLTDKGFYVASQSASNYPKTFLSLASSLNMQYLDNLSQYKNSTDQTLTDRMIENNNVVVFLKSLGYSYFQLGSWWGSTHYNRLADNNFIIESTALSDIGEFNYMLLNSSMLNPFVSKLLPKVSIGESNEDKRARVLYQLEELPKIAKMAGPKFVFTHLISPHGPYVFGNNCEFIDTEQTKGNTEEQNYVNQLSCINQKLEKALTGIIKNSSKSPVILLQADEGPNFINGKLIPSDNWQDANTELIKEKFPILSAYYLPGKSTSSLYSAITPVNSFREIFNLYFSANLPFLPDKNYIFRDMNHLYDFIDVSDKLKN